MTIFSERRYRDLVALQHTAAAKRLGIVGTGWLTTFYKDEFAHTLIGKDRCVCVTASLPCEPGGSGRRRSFFGVLKSFVQCQRD
jgi:hypothetical protein